MTAINRSAFDARVVKAARAIVALRARWGDPPNINCSELIRRPAVAVRNPFRDEGGEPYPRGELTAFMLWQWARDEPNFELAVGNGVGIAFFDSPHFSKNRPEPNHVGLVISRATMIASCGQHCPKHDGPVEHPVAHAGALRGWIQFPAT